MRRCRSLSCGACCAWFRVWSEAEPFLGGRTPPTLTERLDPHRLVMLGTQARQPRCVALQCEVGRSVACAIYAERPSPCALQPAWESGAPSPQCDRARAAHGLPPLTPEHWIDPDGPGLSPLPRSA